MEINRVGLNKVTNLYNNNKKTIEKTSGVTKKDSLEISSVGKSLSTFSMDEKFVNSPEKIEKLRSEIAKGTYKSDMSLTAKKMIDMIKDKEI